MPTSSGAQLRIIQNAAAAKIKKKSLLSRILSEEVRSRRSFTRGITGRMKSDKPKKRGKTAVAPSAKSNALKFKVHRKTPQCDPRRRSISVPSVDYLSATETVTSVVKPRGYETVCTQMQVLNPSTAAESEEALVSCVSDRQAMFVASAEREVARFPGADNSSYLSDDTASSTLVSESSKHRLLSRDDSTTATESTTTFGRGDGVVGRGDGVGGRGDGVVGRERGRYGGNGAKTRIAGRGNSENGKPPPTATMQLLMTTSFVARDTRRTLESRLQRPRRPIARQLEYEEAAVGVANGDGGVVANQSAPPTAYLSAVAVTTSKAKLMSRFSSRGDCEVDLEGVANPRNAARGGSEDSRQRIMHEMYLDDVIRLQASEGHAPFVEFSGATATDTANGYSATFTASATDVDTESLVRGAAKSAGTGSRGGKCVSPVNSALMNRRSHRRLLAGGDATSSLRQSNLQREVEKTSSSNEDKENSLKYKVFREVKKYNLNGNGQGSLKKNKHANLRYYSDKIDKYSSWGGKKKSDEIKSFKNQKIKMNLNNSQKVKLYNKNKCKDEKKDLMYCLEDRQSVTEENILKNNENIKEDSLKAGVVKLLKTLQKAEFTLPKVIGYHWL